MWTADHTCGRREAVDESGEQPEEQPNGLETMVGSERPRALPKRQSGRNGEERNGSKRQEEEKKATRCTLSFTSQPQPQAAAATAAVRLQRRADQLKDLIGAVQACVEGFQSDTGEMSQLDEWVREPTDVLDAAENSTRTETVVGQICERVRSQMTVAKDAMKFSAVECPLRCESLGSRLRALHWLETC